jgi:hypothetical protein
MSSTSHQGGTVNEALHRVVLEETRRRHVDELAAGALPDLADEDTMTSAWRCAATSPTPDLQAEPD